MVDERGQPVFGISRGLSKLKRAARIFALPLVTALLCLTFASSAGASLIDASDGQLGAFSAGTSQEGGTLTAAGVRYRGDGQTFAAAYSGAGSIAAYSGAGSSGQAEGSFAVDWTPEQSVAYGASFYLPYGFHEASSGQQTLIGWHAVPGSDGSYTEDSVIVDYSDNLGELVATSSSGGSVNQQVLVGPFQVPLGAWFSLQVRQVLDAGSKASSQVYVNGQLVGASSAPNFVGNNVSSISYGIDSLDGGADQGPVSLYFDQAFAASYTRYLNPLRGDGYHTERTDQGVDFCLSRGEPIRALGDGVVIGIDRDWFRGEPYVWYQLVDGPFAGHYVYVAEQINRLAHPGTLLSAGQPVAYYKSSGTCIETGWSMGNGATRARVTTGYREGQVTVAGVSFARFLRSLGVQGPFELRPTQAVRRPVKGARARRFAAHARRSAGKR